MSDKIVVHPSFGEISKEELIQRIRETEKLKQIDSSKLTNARRELKKLLQSKYAEYCKCGRHPLPIWTTMRGVYYIIRKKLGGVFDMSQYSTFTTSLAYDCEKWLGVKREELGIIASEKSQLLFRGKNSPIRWDNFQMLAENGSDLLFCEKEGICDLLEPYAAEYGVAIVNLRGFSPEYAKYLGVEANRTEGNIFTLTDMDSSGYLISTIPNSIRLGIDFRTLEELNIPLSEVEEIATVEAKTHWKSLVGKHEPELIQFLKEKRVELDSVLAYTTAEGFWNYLKRKMEEKAPTRMLTRSLKLRAELPDEITTALVELEGLAESIARETINQEVRKCGYDRKIANSLLKVEEVESKLKTLGVEAVRSNSKINELFSQIKRLLEERR